MKYIKKFEELNEYSADYYVEVSLEDALSYCEGHPIPSKDPMPLNIDIVQYGIGSDLDDEGTDDDYKEIVMEKCPWYDGTEDSVKDGVNAVDDFEYATEFDQYILGVKTKSQIAQFSSMHIFIKDYRKINVIFVYDCENEVFIKPEYFKFYIDTKKYNL